MRENLVQPLLTHVLQRCLLVFRLIWRQCFVFVEDSGTLAASRWWYRFPETSEHNLSLSSSCLKERNLQLRHTEVCWTVDTVTPAGQTFALNCSHCCHPSFFCSIKVISCKLNTSLLSYWLNEAQLKKVIFCRLTRREVFFFYPPKNVQNMSSILHKKLQTLTSGRDITNLFAYCRLWVTDVGSDVIWVKATDHILFNSTKLFF